MKKIFLPLLILMCASCSHQKEAVTAVETFISAWKNSDVTDMKSVYPEVDNLPAYLKSDEATIKSIKETDNDRFEIVVHNKFTNGFGKAFEKDITFFVKPKSEDDKSVYTIYESKGLCSYAESEAANYYRFAKSIGAIKSAEQRDVKIAEGIKNSIFLFMDYSAKVREYLSQNVVFSGFNWSTGYYTNYASGNAVCKNNTMYNIPRLKYRVSFSRNGEVVTQEDGYITYNTLSPGQSTSFSFYSSNVGNANRASVEAIFDDELITNIVANTQYTGNEYDEFMKKK